MAAALPAWSQAPRCDAETCPPLQLRLEEGFGVSSQRLAEGTAATPAPAPAAEERARVIRQAQKSPAPLSPWLIGLLALVAGMLLQGLVQRQLQRRRVPATAAVAAATPPAVARATGIERDAAPAPQIAVEPLFVADAAVGEDSRSEPLAAPEPIPASPSAELDAAFEASPEPPTLFEPEPLAASDEPVEETSAPEPKIVAESPSAELDAAFEAPPAPAEELPISPVFGLEPLPALSTRLAEEPPATDEVTEFPPEPVLLAEPPSDELPVVAEALTVPAEESQDPVVFELEPLPAQSDAVLADEPSVAESELFAEPPADELFVTAEAPPVPAEGLHDPVVFELESLQAQFTTEPVEPQAVEPADEAPAEPEMPEAAPVAQAQPDAADPFGDMVDDILAPLDFQLELEDLTAASAELPPLVEPEAELFAEEAAAEEPAVDAEAAPAVSELPPEPMPVAAQPAPAPVPASDTTHLETVGLLRRLSAQRARGLHPEARLAQVFRRISSGRTDAADKALRELEAFCSNGEEAFPSELMTTRQYIVRGRDQELGKRIEALRERARNEASGRRLAVAGAFLKRGRFDAVAEVLDELESDLSKENETP